MNTDREHHPFDITQIGFRRLAPSHGPEPLANVTLEERSKSWFLERSGTGSEGVDMIRIKVHSDHVEALVRCDQGHGQPDSAKPHDQQRGHGSGVVATRM